MTDSSSVIKSTLHEQERHRLAQTGSTLNKTDQTTLSKNRGDQSQKTWNAYSGLAGISTQSTSTQSAWNMVNAGRTNVAAGTAQIQRVNSEEVEPLVFALPFVGAEVATVAAGGAAVGASAVVAAVSKGPVETVLDGVNWLFGIKPTPLPAYTPGYNSTGGSQAYNSGPTRYSNPRVGRGSSNTETSLFDYLGLGPVFSEKIGTITTRKANSNTRLGGKPGDPAVNIKYQDGTEFDMTGSRVKETEANRYQPGRFRPKRFDNALDKKGTKRAPTSEEKSWFDSITW